LPLEARINIKTRNTRKFQLSKVLGTLVKELISAKKPKQHISHKIVSLVSRVVLYTTEFDNFKKVFIVCTVLVL